VAKQLQPSVRDPFTALERRAVAALGSIFALRMFGLFLIVPVFALYAEGLAGTTPLLVGLALGAYGLTQALLQIPYGLASDRFGRKPLIALGLVVFAAGSIVAAASDSIYGVIVGRALQGTGAIAAVVLATVADLTRESQRTKAMAVIGVSIGATFMVSLILGPVLQGLVGVRGIFLLTALLAGAGLVALFVTVPTPHRAAGTGNEPPLRAQFAQVVRDTGLLRLNLGIFLLHLTLTALFVVVPLELVGQGLPASGHWRIYLPVIVLSVVGMVPLVFLSGRPGLLRPVMAVAVGMLATALTLLAAGHGHFAWLVFALWVYFLGFNVLEALLPSLVSRLAPPRAKGAAIGVYNSSEFLGAFLGGAIGGFLHGQFGVGAVFSGCAVMILGWLAVVLASPAPRLLDSLQISVGRCGEADAKALAERFAAVPGVVEAVVVAEEGVVYLKVDRRVVDPGQLEALAGAA